MVGLSECSLLAADITDLTFKMLLNISAAKHLWKCVVSEAWSSLAWWLQPRWVVEAPAQDQSRSWQGGNCLSRIASMKYVIWILCPRPIHLWAGSPETIHFKASAKRGLLSCSWGGRGSVRILSGFFSAGYQCVVLHVDLFLVGDQLSRSMHVC